MSKISEQLKEKAIQLCARLNIYSEANVDIVWLYLAEAHLDGQSYRDMEGQ